MTAPYLKTRLSSRSARSNCGCHVRFGILAAALLTVCPLAAPAPAETGFGQARLDVLLRERSSAAGMSDALRAAWTHFHAFEFEKALEVFEAVHRESTAPTDLIQALYGIGLCHRYFYPNPDLNRAREVFLTILREYPDSSTVPWLQVELGSMFDLDDPVQRLEARERFETVIHEHPGSLAIHEAVLRLAYTYLTFETELDALWPGVELLEEHLGNCPDNPLAGSMHLRLDRFYFAYMQDYAKSEPHAVRLGQLRMEDPFRRSSQYWHTSMVFIRQGEPRRAIFWLERLLDEAPLAREAFSARLLLERIRNFDED